VFDQLTEAEWSKATHKRSSSRTSHPASHMITNLAPGPTVLTNPKFPPSRSVDAFDQVVELLITAIT